MIRSMIDLMIDWLGNRSNDCLTYWFNDWFSGWVIGQTSGLMIIDVMSDWMEDCLFDWIIYWMCVCHHNRERGLDILYTIILPIW